jgi:HEPN domain-containing protein
MRNPPLDEARRWLGEAQADLDAARLLASNGLHHLACFHCQQAAEKALKAFLYGRGEEGVVGHSVFQLLRKAVRYDAALGELPDLRVLDAYYVTPRYPNGVPADTTPRETFGPGQSKIARETAEKVLTAVRERIEPLSMPPP